VNESEEVNVKLARTNIQACIKVLFSKSGANCGLKKNLMVMGTSKRLSSGDWRGLEIF